MDNDSVRSSRRLYIQLVVILAVCMAFLVACDLSKRGQDEGVPHSMERDEDKVDKPSDERDETRDEASNGDSNGSNGSVEDTDDLSKDDISTQELERQVQQAISTMTLEEKVAQIFIITPEALTSQEQVTTADEDTRNAIKTYPVGGIVYFGANIVSPDQIKQMTEKTQMYAKEVTGIPMFLAIDEEGGSVARIGRNENFSVRRYTDMASIGATKDLTKAYEVGETIGRYLHGYGFNLNFAPNADVLTNPNNKVVGNRSFGSDGNVVAKMSLEVAKGLSESQILSCFKHFPGHGATEGDTHDGFAYTNKTLQELMENELIPFQAAADYGIPFIMMSHISTPNITGGNSPSSLSKVMVSDILRSQMGYNGIIITDSMSMGAIVNTYSARDAAIRSFEAGVDMILMPESFPEAYQGVLDAVGDGTISEQRIHQSLERILRVKFKTQGMNYL